MPRVYHNRRRTAWTDWEEDDAIPKVDAGADIKRQSTASTEASDTDVILAAKDAASEAPSPKAWPPLLVAAQRKQADKVIELLKLGADPDCQEPVSGWTPLMYAATNGDQVSVRALLAHKASVNHFAAAHDWNALCAAIMVDHDEIISMLLDAGADGRLIKTRHPDLAETYAAALRKCKSGGAARGSQCSSALHGMRVRDYALSC
mmetsp:Transcript_55122/g.118319  ORF Transcript_55122/g.118319 Transcript_55122/m.118319 type:complete len:205 (-) Transcript_55122:110-724(-)